MSANSTVNTNNIQNNSNNQNMAQNENQNKNIVEEPNLKLEINDKQPYHLQIPKIIWMRTYNLEVYTDMTCIQKPDENNLFTGFEDKDIYLSPKVTIQF